MKVDFHGAFRPQCTRMPSKKKKNLKRRTHTYHAR